MIIFYKTIITQAENWTFIVIIIPTLIQMSRYVSKYDSAHLKTLPVLPGGLVKKSRISHCWCIDPMVGATSLYDVTLHWRVTSLKWLPYYSMVSFAEG